MSQPALGDVRPGRTPRPRHAGGPMHRHELQLPVHGPIQTTARPPQPLSRRLLRRPRRDRVRVEIPRLRAGVRVHHAALRMYRLPELHRREHRRGDEGGGRAVPGRQSHRDIDGPAVGHDAELRAQPARAGPRIDVRADAALRGVRVHRGNPRQELERSGQRAGGDGPSFVVRGTPCHVRVPVQLRGDQSCATHRGGDDGPRQVRRRVLLRHGDGIGHLRRLRRPVRYRIREHRRRIGHGLLGGARRRVCVEEVGPGGQLHRVL
mmetsp:Transcript_21382/g.51680  ORF Transcript_21382/g.51680 Transcript_21382/m.51680 type:complete len:264 (+) Transcript_21382:281-1072(+)